MASTVGDESSRPSSTTAESSQSAPPSPSAAVYTLCTKQPLDGGDDAELHHLRILVSILGSDAMNGLFLFVLDSKREERNELSGERS
ncbi:hypothetical protein Droror1_Dr00023554 [Drosera rotundifolia]